MNPETAPSRCIGVFDSGVGGLSVLHALRRRMPHAPLIYVGDVAYAPYGERDTAEVIEQCHRIVTHLAGAGARTIVVACNTATVLGIEAMRRRWPELNFVGVEPGVKPAAARSRTRRIAVMATPATAASRRLRHLIETYAVGVHVHIQPCPGLAGAIEHGVDGETLRSVLGPLCDDVRAADVDTVALGCTHYAFAARIIQQMVGTDVALIDTADAVAARVAFLCRGEGRSDGAPCTAVFSTGATARMATLLRQCPGLQSTGVATLTL